MLRKILVTLFPGRYAPCCPRCGSKIRRYRYRPLFNHYTAPRHTDAQIAALNEALKTNVPEYMRRWGVGQSEAESHFVNDVFFG